MNIVPPLGCMLAKPLRRTHLLIFLFVCQLLPNSSGVADNKIPGCCHSKSVSDFLSRQNKSRNFLGFTKGSLLTNSVPPVAGLTSMNHLINLTSPFSISIPVMQRG